MVELEHPPTNTQSTQIILSTKQPEHPEHPKQDWMSGAQLLSP